MSKSINFLKNISFPKYQQTHLILRNSLVCNLTHQNIFQHANDLYI